MAVVNINNCPVRMQVDSGTSCTIINKETWSKISKSSDRLLPSDILLQTWSAQKLNVLGKAEKNVKYGEFCGPLILHVIAGGGL